MFDEVVVNKERAFELLRKRGAARAELYFQGGHDQGAVESIRLFSRKPDGQSGPIEEDLPVWYCGGYSLGENGQWVPLNKAANEEEELSELLQGPVDATFGSWASVDSTSGTLVWDVETGTVTMDYVMDEPREHTETW